jgi:hypothetical protein
MKNIGDLINLLDDKLGFFFFKNNNLFSYNLFSKFFEKKIIKESSNLLINSYKKNGFAKGPAISRGLVDQINSEIQKQKVEMNKNNFYLFKWTDELKILLKKIIHQELYQTIVDLQMYHCSPIILTHVRIQRNFGYKKEAFKEQFSDNFHNDRWLCTYIKIFINLEDVGEDKGPTYIIPKNKTADFIKTTNYKSRNNYKDIRYKNTYLNIGASGESFVFNPSQCIHRAGIPAQGQKRDIMMLQLCVTPNYNKQDLKKIDVNLTDEAFGDYDKLSYYYTKPYGLKKTYKLFEDFLNFK